MAHQPNPADVILNAVEDPETHGWAFVAQSTARASIALEGGAHDFDYESAVELAAYHILSVEAETRGDPQDIIRDVVQKRNEMKRDPEVMTPETENQFTRPPDDSAE